MSQRQKFIQLQARSGKMVTAGPISVTPQSQALMVRWPSAGWTWNRPVSVTVQYGQNSERIPIIDLTRIIQLSLLGLSAVFIVTGLVVSLRRSHQNE